MTSPTPPPFCAPDVWHFPPLFTLQPVDATRARQLEAWRGVLLGWAAAERRTSPLPLREWPLWENAALPRRLSDEGIAAVADAAVAAGAAAWHGAARGVDGALLLFWRAPAAWGAELHAWAAARGLAAPGAVYTLYELRTASEWAGSPAQSLAPPMLLAALEALQREGLAALDRGAAGDAAMDEVGVKFRER